MPKIPDCDRCQYFANSPHMVCGINPCGPEGQTCSEFSADAENSSEDNPQPLGGGYYAGDWIPQPFPEISADRQAALLDWHPLFSGRCPNCERPIVETKDRQWSCAFCNWEERVGSHLFSKG